MTLGVIMVKSKKKISREFPGEIKTWNVTKPVRYKSVLSQNRESEEN